MGVNNSLEAIVKAYRHPDLMLERIVDATTFNSFRSKVPCDFFGQVSGRPCVLECKETIKDSIPFSKLYREQSSHQLDFLKRWRQHHERSIAGYLVYFKNQGVIGFACVSLIGRDGSLTPSSIGLQCTSLNPLKLKEILCGS